MTAHNENTDKSEHPASRFQATGIRILEFSSFIFYKTYFSWKRMSDKVLELAGLTHAQYVFLCVLQSLESKRQKPTQNGLARLTDFYVTMTSHVLRTLQKRGLIERKRINGDKRDKYFKLLPAGKQLIKKAEKIMDKFEQEYFLPTNNDFLQCLKALTTVREAYQ